MAIPEISTEPTRNAGNKLSPKTSKMKAVVLYKTCSPEELTVSEIPVPEVKPGWVLIKVKAFGLNRSELMMREYEGNAPYIKLPRVLGIECAGEIADASDSAFRKGQKVVALMGGMGRSFDGSYDEYTLVPTKNTFSVETDLDWTELAAIPETYFTAYGSLFNACNWFQKMFYSFAEEQVLRDLQPYNWQKVLEQLYWLQPEKKTSAIF